MASPWWTSGRPRRSGVARREQAARAQARVVGHLLRGVQLLSAHRGCAPTRLSVALVEALCRVAPAEAPVAPAEYFDIADDSEDDGDVAPVDDSVAACAAPTRGAPLAAHEEVGADTSEGGHGVSSRVADVCVGGSPGGACAPAAQAATLGTDILGAQERGPAAEADGTALTAGKKKNKAFRKKAQAAAGATVVALIARVDAALLACTSVFKHRHRCGMPGLPHLRTLEARMLEQSDDCVDAARAGVAAMAALSASRATVGGASASAGTHSALDSALERARQREALCDRAIRATLDEVLAAVAMEHADQANAEHRTAGEGA